MSWQSETVRPKAPNASQTTSEQYQSSTPPAEIPSPASSSTAASASAPSPSSYSHLHSNNTQAFDYTRSPPQIGIRVIKGGQAQRRAEGENREQQNYQGRAGAPPQQQYTVKREARQNLQKQNTTQALLCSFAKSPTPCAQSANSNAITNTPRLSPSFSSSLCLSSLSLSHSQKLNSQSEPKSRSKPKPRHKPKPKPKPKPKSKSKAKQRRDFVLRLLSSDAKWTSAEVTDYDAGILKLRIVFVGSSLGKDKSELGCSTLDDSIADSSPLVPPSDIVPDLDSIFTKVSYVSSQIASSFSTNISNFKYISKTSQAF